MMAQILHRQNMILIALAIAVSMLGAVQLHAVYAGGSDGDVPQEEPAPTPEPQPAREPQPQPKPEPAPASEPTPEPQVVYEAPGKGPDEELPNTGAGSVAMGILGSGTLGMSIRGWLMSRRKLLGSLLEK